MKNRKLRKMITTIVAAGLICGLAIPNIAFADADAAAKVEDFPTIQSFTEDQIPEEDVIKIVNAGINAPSAINQQPWHFSVVTDPAMFDEINGGDSSGDSAGSDAEAAEGAEAPAAESEGGESEGGEAAESEGGESEGAEGGEAAASTSAKASVGDSPLVIIVSAAPEATGTEPAFDAGLACMSMAIEAGLLGYGAKIVTSPTMTLNAAGQDQLRAKLGIPEGYSVVGVLLVGVPAQDEADIVASASTRNDFNDVVTMITGDGAKAGDDFPAEDAVTEATEGEAPEGEAPAEGESAEGESESAEGEAPAEGAPAEGESAEGESESAEGESPEGEAPQN